MNAQRSGLILLAVTTIATALSLRTESARADDLNPNMCWEGMGEVGALEPWGAFANCDDGQGNFGQVSCGVHNSRSNCSYKFDSGVSGTQVTAQFQCCNASGTSCDGWAWSTAGWTAPNSSITGVVPCTGSTRRYAKVSCLVAAPCN
jgi:hypothetical protein